MRVVTVRRREITSCLPLGSCTLAALSVVRGKSIYRVMSIGCVEDTRPRTRVSELCYSCRSHEHDMSLWLQTSFMQISWSQCMEPHDCCFPPSRDRFLKLGRMGNGWHCFDQEQMLIIHPLRLLHSRTYIRASDSLCRGLKMEFPLFPHYREEIANDRSTHCKHGDYSCYKSPTVPFLCGFLPCPIHLLPC